MLSKLDGEESFRKLLWKVSRVDSFRGHRYRNCGVKRAARIHAHRIDMHNFSFASDRLGLDYQRYIRYLRERLIYNSVMGFTWNVNLAEEQE